MAIYASKVSRGLWAVPLLETADYSQAQIFKAVASQGLWVADRPSLPVPPAPPPKVVVVTGIEGSIRGVQPLVGTVSVCNGSSSGSGGSGGGGSC